MIINARYAALLLSIACLAACGQVDDESAAVTETARAPWAEFAATTVAAYFRLNPERAVNAGLHQYDGQISDITLDAVAEYLVWVKKTRGEVQVYDDLPR